MDEPPSHFECNTARQSYIFGTDLCQKWRLSACLNDASDKAASRETTSSPTGIAATSGGEEGIDCGIDTLAMGDDRKATYAADTT